MLCTFSLHIFCFKNLWQSQKSLEEYFRSSFECIYIIYIHSWAYIYTHTYITPISSDRLEGMPDSVYSLPPNSVLFGYDAFNVNQAAANPAQMLIDIPSFSFFKHCFNTESPSFLAQEIIHELCAGVLCPSYRSFGLIQLRCRTAQKQKTKNKNTYN